SGAARGRDAETVAAFLGRALPRGTGGTALAVRGGRLLYCGGFGAADRAAGRPASCDTSYDIMSLTKQFTAAAVLKLELLGRLRVSDPISRFLGPVPADKRGITVEHLLTHTSGLPESLGDDYAPLTRGQLIRKALASGLDSRPGKEFHYSNTGYSLLAAIIEEASGEDYEPFLVRHLFAPAGMKHTGYLQARRPRELIAVEYDSRGRSKGRPFDHPWAADGPYWNLRGNGGMLSTAPDLFAWHRALTGDRILPAAARARLLAPRVRVPDSDDSYGYGWNVRDTPEGPLTWHDGGNGWSLALLARAPRDGTMVFWVTNHVQRKGSWDLEERAGAVTEGLLERARDGNS
ncbi:class A beta-lactamase-related serine hydrolase, partial [Streptomyces triticagri]